MAEALKKGASLQEVIQLETLRLLKDFRSQGYADGDDERGMPAEKFGVTPIDVVVQLLVVSTSLVACLVRV